MNDQDLTPLAAAGAAFAAWIPEENLPFSFLLLEKKQRWDNARAEGKTWLEANDEQALKLLLPRVLDGPQSACLFANLVSKLHGTKSPMNPKNSSELEKLLKIYGPDAGDLIRSVESLLAHDTIKNDEQWELCCAALLALSGSDDEQSIEEEQFLEWFALEKSHVDAGRKILNDLKSEGVLAKIYRLNSRQKRFLAANLFALMLCDGSWRPNEQEKLDEFTDKLHISRSEIESLLKATYTMFNLSVFD